MKLRIKGNSVRIRLSRTEVDNLAKDGYVEDRTEFGISALRYALRCKDEISALQADFNLGKLTMYVPANLATAWPKNEIVGFNNTIDLPGNKQLFLLLEKDFKCIDNSMEDQSDNYDNPNSVC